MPTRAQVEALLSEGHSYQTAGRTLGIPPGQAFMIATGRPAETEDQALVNPPHMNPTRKASVIRWVQERAARELTGGAPS